MQGSGERSSVGSRGLAERDCPSGETGSRARCILCKAVVEMPWDRRRRAFWLGTALAEVQGSEPVSLQSQGSPARPTPVRAHTRRPRPFDSDAQSSTAARPVRRCARVSPPSRPGRVPGRGRPRLLERGEAAASRTRERRSRLLQQCWDAIEQARALLQELETIPLDPHAHPDDVRARRQVKARAELISRALALLREAEALLEHWQSKSVAI